MMLSRGRLALCITVLLATSLLVLGCPKDKSGGGSAAVTVNCPNATIYNENVTATANGGYITIEYKFCVRCGEEKAAAGVKVTLTVKGPKKDLSNSGQTDSEGCFSGRWDNLATSDFGTEDEFRGRDVNFQVNGNNAGTTKVK